MQMNLKTTLKAYPKISPSVLSNYLTKEELATELDGRGYVVDAPADSKAYARQDSSWVSLDKDIVQSTKDVFYGPSKEVRLCSEAEIQSLGGSYTTSEEEKTYDIEYIQTKVGYFWICSTAPIKAIKWGAGFKADFIKQDVDITTDEGLTYYCYRSSDMLIPNDQVFGIKF